jgi:riboflavin biosynthesis pyrimidine reductase
MRRLLPSAIGEELTDDDLFDMYAGSRPDQVRAGMVSSLDGAVAVRGRSGGLGSPGDHRVFSVLRAIADVVLVGAGTARTERYGPVVLPAELQRRRDCSGRTARPALAVVTASMALDVGSRLFEDPQQRVLVLAPAGRSRTRDLPAHVELVGVGEVEVDPVRVVGELAARGLSRVLCEGGPRLLATLLAADVVDELCLTTSPQLVGGSPGLLPVALPDPRRARLRSLVEDDGVLLSRWSLR